MRPTLPIEQNLLRLCVRKKQRESQKQRERDEERETGGEKEIKERNRVGVSARHCACARACACVLASVMRACAHAHVSARTKDQTHTLLKSPPCARPLIHLEH